MKTLAIIPARGGSKSIPKKNIKLLGDKPLIAYQIELAKSVPEIDRVVVSTDSEEIAQVAKKYGAEVPFIRPADLAQDETPTLPVLQHCTKYLEENEGYRADVIVLLFPTNPFLTKERVSQAIELMIEEKTNTVMAVEKDWGRYWVYDSITNNYKILYPKERVNRQYYKPLYKENAAICFTYVCIMVKDKIVDDENISFVVLEPGEVVDIDTPEDWAEAEKKVL